MSRIVDARSVPPVRTPPIDALMVGGGGESRSAKFVASTTPGTKDEIGFGVSAPVGTDVRELVTLGVSEPMDVNVPLLATALFDD